MEGANCGPVVGANGVTQHIQHQERCVKPKVEVEEEGVSEVVGGHKFMAETAKFHYIGNLSGKHKHFFKNFEDIKAEIWNELEIEKGKSKMDLAKDLAEVEQAKKRQDKFDEKEKNDLALEILKEKSKQYDGATRPGPEVRQVRQ